MTPTQAQDAEANAFAMELLMPFDWIVRDCADLCLTDDAGIAKLAKRYAVPVSVMAIRIGEVRQSLEDSDAGPDTLGGYGASEGRVISSPKNTGQPS